MIKFTAILEKFGKKGEKTGWTYIHIDFELVAKLKPNNKKSFRVKGKLDSYPIEQVSLLPMGNGDFILPVNASMRKGIKKLKGDKVIVHLEEDLKPLAFSTDFLECLEEEKEAKSFFVKLPKSHQNYYSKWIESAKTDSTKIKRIAQSICGFKMKMNYPEMIRYYKNQKTS